MSRKQSAQIRKVNNMIVKGKEIPTHQIYACEDWMLAVNGFTAGELATCAISKGVPMMTAYRFADRLIQKLKKNGLIKFNGKTWEKI